MRVQHRILLAFIVCLLLGGCGAQICKLKTPSASQPVYLHMATFDSGFGGFFTARSMAIQAKSVVSEYNVVVSVTHYGDTRNAPYGEKSPEQIAALTQLGVEKALDEGASVVVIACNTASTQYNAVVDHIRDVRPGREQHVLSIITPTLHAVKDHLDRYISLHDTAVLAIFATPATVKSMTYPEKLAEIYQGTLKKDALQELKQNDWKDHSRQTRNFFSRSIIQLPEKKAIFVYQFAPGNWVSMIEEGADEETKQHFVQHDMKQFLERLPSTHKPDVVGLFCTHYPVFKQCIKDAMIGKGYAKHSTEYIEQGCLASAYAYDAIYSLYRDHVRIVKPSNHHIEQLSDAAIPTIVISGDNLTQTEGLVNTIFPELKGIRVVRESFVPESCH